MQALCGETKTCEGGIPVRSAIDGIRTHYHEWLVENAGLVHFMTRERT